jgi:PAS domain S-box-containing protein
MTPEKKTQELIEKQRNGGMAFGENFFRLAFERSADALLLLENGVFTDCNEAAVKMLRAKSKEEILITPPAQLSPQFQPDGQPSAQKAEEMIQTAIRNGSHRFEWLHRRMDGEVFPVEVLLTSIKVGERTVVYTSWRDITERKKEQETLRISQQRYETIFNASPVMFWLKDTQNNMIQINRAAAEFEGTLPDDITGRSSYDLYPREQAEAFYQDDLEVIRSKKPKLGIVEKHTSPGTGKTAWLETGKAPVMNEHGEVVGVLAFAVDITEREQAAEELRRFQLMVQNSSEFINMADMNGRMIFLNAAGRKMLGLEEEEVPRLTVLDAIAPEYLSLAQNEVLPSLAEKGGWSGELRYRNLKTNETTDVFASAYVLKNPKTGEPQYLVNISRDITELKRVEESIKQSQTRFQNLVETLGEWVWEVDNKGTYTYVSPNIKNLLGYEPEEVLGKTPFDLMPPEEAQRVAGVFGALISARQPLVEIENTNLHKDGRLVILETNGVPFFDANGQVLGYRGTDRDVTERKRLETQLQQAFEKRGYQVQISTQIAQELSAAAELNELFERVVTLTKERLGYYHTQLLRYDPALDAVALVSGYGEIGRKMLADGHKMPLGSGLIGVAAAAGETVMRPVLAEDPDWHPNPLLPETKGEIAVPIKLGDQILGVLDVQSDKEGELTEDDRLLLEGLCGQIAVAIEQTRLRQEMTERLEEVNRLYRAMSREGWKTYRETGALPDGFMFDQSGLKPLEGIALASERFVQVPMKVLGGEVVGDLAVAEDPQRPLSPEDLNFLEQISEQVALALESARLSAQTQLALAQTEKLSEASLNLTRANDLQQLLQVVVDTLDISRINRALIGMFQYDSANELTGLTIVANWWNGTGNKATEIGTRYSAEVVRVINLFQTSEPLFFNDTLAQEDVDEGTLRLVRSQNIRAVAVLPLFTGERQIGVLILESEEPHNFTQSEIRLFSAMGPQVATVLENRRQFERARQQAEREGLLNVISQKIQSATSVEAVLQIAARELGHALGAPLTIAQLSMKDKK